MHSADCREHLDRHDAAALTSASNRRRRACVHTTLPHRGHCHSKSGTVGFGHGHQHGPTPAGVTRSASDSARMWSANSPIVDSSHVASHESFLHIAMCSASRTFSVPRSPHWGQVLAGDQAGESQPVTILACSHHDRIEDSTALRCTSSAPGTRPWSWWMRSAVFRLRGCSPRSVTQRAAWMSMRAAVSRASRRATGRDS
jgi:hypothetical protein